MSTRQKGPDEIFCRSCGEPIKKEAEICPECGVRNKKAESQTASQSTGVHDPSQYETTVSSDWWYGIVAGVVLWIIVFTFTQSAPAGAGEAILGLLALIAWAIMPIAVYFDIQYVRANARWNPNTIFWLIGMIIWLVNIILGVVYLYRRHETLGNP